MSRNFEEISEVESISIENFPYKSSTQVLKRLNESFDSSSYLKNESNSSFTSQHSVDENFTQTKNSTLQVPKNIQKLGQNQTNSIKPANVLKTTFLSEDVVNYNFPKKNSVPLEKKHNKSVSEINNSNFSENIVIKEVKYVDENNKIYDNKEQFQKICDLESQIIKKNCLVETLRARNSKLIEELEDTHKRLASAKNCSNEDYLNKIQQLGRRCEEYESKLQEMSSKEREYASIIRQKDFELSQIDREAKVNRNENQHKLERLLNVENELKNIREEKNYLEKINETLRYKLEMAERNFENLKLKLENAEKNNEGLKVRLETSEKNLENIISQKLSLEKEISQSKIEKNTQETEIQNISKDYEKTIQNISKKLEQTSEESRYYETLYKEASEKHTKVTKDYADLSAKLISLEEKCKTLDSLKFPVPKELHCRSISSHIEEDHKKPSKIDLENPFFTFKNTQDQNKHKKQCHLITNSFKTLLKEIMTILNVASIFEIIPALNNHILGKNEKKLVKKLGKLVSDCFNQEKSFKDISPGYIWKLIKKVFEEYALLKKNSSAGDFTKIKQLLGEDNLYEKISNICIETTHLRNFVSKLKQKCKLSTTSPLSDLESLLL